MKILHSYALVIAGIILSTSLTAQHKEVAVRLLNLGDLSSTEFMYKKQKTATTYRRYRLWSGNLNFTFLDEDVSRTGIGGGFSTGLENRKRISDRAQFIHGLEVGLSFNYFKEADNTSRRAFSASLGYVLGLQYSISPAFAVGIETIPSLSYTGNRTKNNSFTDTSHRLGLNFSSSNIAFTGVYRWAADQEKQ